MRRNIKGTIVTVMFILLITVIFIAYWLYNKYTPGKEEADRGAYYGVTADEQPAVVIDSSISGTNGLIMDGTAYIAYDTVRQNLNDRFYYDSTENLLLYTLPESIVSAKPDTAQYSVDDTVVSADHAIAVTNGSTVYIAADFVQKYTNIDFTVYDSPGRIFITKTWGTVRTAAVGTDTQLRESADIKSPIVADISAGSEVTVISAEDSWSRISTDTGEIGYVQTKKLKDQTDRETSRAFDEPAYTSLRSGESIRMAWHQVTSQSANSKLSTLIADAGSLNTIAPTWFFIKDTEGNIESLASSSYVSTAHQAGMKVWSVVNDFDGQSLYGGINSTDETMKLLSRTSSRQNLEKQVVLAALDAGSDGINVDFEKVSEDCGLHYLEFIREMSVLCRRNGLVLSVDSYVPSAWTTQYHRAEQGATVDYVVIMAYDEHGDWSDEIGPNSSIPYVKQAISDTTAEVPADEIILGIPFYTRLWQQIPVAGSNDYKISCSTCDMQTAADTISENGAQVTYDEQAGENLGSYTVNGIVYSIWLEDDVSISAKLALVKSNGLAGFSAWKLGQEQNSVWSIVDQYK